MQRTRAVALMLLVALAAVACAVPARQSIDSARQVVDVETHEPSPTDHDDDLSAASPSPGPQPPSGTTTASEPPRAVTHDPAAINAFAFQLLDALEAGTRNVVMSPLSAALLLGMLHDGAAGQTREAIAAVLNLQPGGEPVRSIAGDDDVTLRMANALWGNLGFPVNDSYVGHLASAYRAEAGTLDLGSQQGADHIDTWVQDHTSGLIDGIAEALGLPDPQAVLVLLNAVYFKGEWRLQFDPQRTSDRAFTLADGTEAEVPFMHHLYVTDELAYAERDGYRVLRLPYGDGGRFGMEIFLPDESSSLPGMLEDLDAAEWQTAVASLRDTELDEIAMPRLDLSSELPLNDVLAELGMGVAFTSQADFSPISPARPWLSAVVQKARIIVNEEGTEAAAVTGGVMVTSAPPNPPPRFVADRPFAFTISDGDTILFAATVTDPRG